MPLFEEEERLLKAEGAQLADRLSNMIRNNGILLAAAMWQQTRLLEKLRSALKHDPAQEPVDVPPKYRAWFASVVQAKADEHEGARQNRAD